MKYLAIIAAPLLLAGCYTTAENYQKADTSNRQADMETCMAEATREVPQRLDYANIDLNAQVRLGYFDRCMAAKGYQKVG